MKIVKYILLFIGLIIAIFFIYFIFINKNMKITSSAFKDNKMMPSTYACDGENVNPPLEFSNIPKNTKSLTLINDDPDAIGDTPWVHWVVFNIAPTELSVNENSKFKTGIEGLTSWDTTGYGGACPRTGTHRYFFKLYALDVNLNLDKKATKQDIEQAMKGHIIEQVKLTGLYSLLKNR